MNWEVYVQAVSSLLLVIGLMLAALWAVRRWGIGGMRMRPSPQRRLALVEVMPIDGRRRLLLVRRDDTEYLLLVGGPNDLLVEGAIRTAGGGQGEEREA